MFILAPRANLPIIFDNKFGASVVSQGYWNSVQALVGTLTGFAVGPIVSMMYRENYKPMVLHGGIVHMVSEFMLSIIKQNELRILSFIFQV